jgi:hypothetical protein
MLIDDRASEALPDKSLRAGPMKFDVVRSIGHNIAASLASGDNMPTAQWDTDPFAEAEQSPHGFVYVDFLTGTSNSLSPTFERGIAMFGEALIELCQKHGTSPAVFRRLEAKYLHDVQKRFFVTIEDDLGRSVTDEYSGDGRRFQVLDQSGRTHRTRGSVVRTD